MERRERSGERTRQWEVSESWSERVLPASRTKTRSGYGRLGRMTDAGRRTTSIGSVNVIWESDPQVLNLRRGRALDCHVEGEVNSNALLQELTIPHDSLKWRTVFVEAQRARYKY